MRPVANQNFPKRFFKSTLRQLQLGKRAYHWHSITKNGLELSYMLGFANETNIPLHVVENTIWKHDGPIGKELEDPRFILVGDRAYFSIDKVDHYLENRQDFVFRLKDNIQLNRKKSLEGNRSEGSNVIGDFTFKIGTPQKQTKKRHRVVQFLDYKNQVISCFLH